MSADRRQQSVLADELDELGRAVDIQSRDPDLVAEQVMTRLAARGTSVPARRGRWRPALAAVFVVLVVLALTPPVRAAVTDWFGVVITQGEPTGSATVPDADGALGLQGSADAVSFDPIVPDRLVDVHGRPDGVEVSEDRRVLSLSWETADGTVRLDQFDGEMTPAFVKWTGHEEITVEGRPAIWIRNPHMMALLDSAGREYDGMRRAAASTLIWQVRNVTLRLEGLERATAIDVAGSTFGTE